MIRTNCPSCGQKLRVDESLPAALCPACRSKFKVTPDLRRREDVRRPANGGRAKVSRTRASEQPRAPQRPEPEPEEADIPYALPQSSDEIPVPQVVEEESPPPSKEGPALRQSESGARDPWPKRKKKKKKEPDTFLDKIRESSNGLAACSMLVFSVLLVSGFGVSRIFDLGSSTTNSYDPVAEKEAEKEFKKIWELKIEHDDNDPNKPVVAIIAANTDLSGTHITMLKNFPKLRKLDLSGTKLNNNGLGHLVGMKDLKVLDISHTKVGDVIDPLAKLESLEELNLSDTLVRDSGLKKLYGLKNLKKLNIMNTLAGGHDLRANMPQVKINGGDVSTSVPGMNPLQ
jgi:hypothetical protein